MNGRHILFSLLAAASLGLVACSSTTVGTPVTSGSGPSIDTDSPSGSSPPSDGAGVASGIAALRPCDLISAGLSAQFGLAGQGSSTGSGARSCDWQNVTADNGLGYALRIDIRDQQGIKDINPAGYTITEDPIGGHPGRQLKDGTGGDTCAVVIGVTSSSRVDISVSTGTANLDESCALANRLAVAVAPELP